MMNAVQKYDNTTMIKNRAAFYMVAYSGLHITAVYNML